MRKIGSIIASDQGIHWAVRTTEDTSADDSHPTTTTNFFPMSADRSQQQIIDELIGRHLRSGDRLVLIDDRAAVMLGRPGQAPLFDPTMYGDEAPAINVVTAHQALVAYARGGQGGPIVPIAGKLDAMRPFGLVRITESQGNIIVTSSVVDHDGVPHYGTDNVTQTQILAASTTGIIDTVKQLVPILLLGAQDNGQDTGIVVTYEGTAPRTTTSLMTLFRMQFASARFSMNLVVDPLATLCGGLIIAEGA